MIADYFHGDRVATVNDLYPRLVDQIARDRLVGAGVRLGSARPFGRNRAVEAFLHGLSSAEPELPHGGSYRALEKKVTRWVDHGLERLIRAPWGVGLHLEERDGGLALELWLHASDDATVALPAVASLGRRPRRVPLPPRHRSLRRSRRAHSPRYVRSLPSTASRSTTMSRATCRSTPRMRSISCAA